MSGAALQPGGGGNLQWLIPSSWLKRGKKAEAGCAAELLAAVIPSPPLLSAPSAAASHRSRAGRGWAVPCGTNACQVPSPGDRNWDRELPTGTSAASYSHCWVLEPPLPISRQKGGDRDRWCCSSEIRCVWLGCCMVSASTAGSRPHSYCSLMFRN